MLRRHTFGADRNIDYIIALVDLVRRYEFLVAGLLEQPSLRPFDYGGDESLGEYLHAIEGDIMREALARSGGNRTAAAKLTQTSRRRQYRLATVR